MQPKVKEALHNIWQAETREKAYKAFDNWRPLHGKNGTGQARMI
jgi:hypothetical protein